jgi:FkbM family methyltransferase
VFNKVQKAVSILKKDGLVSLFHRIYSAYFYKARLDPEYIISRIIGKRKISINSIYVIVNISGIGTYNEMRFIIDNEIPVIRDILTEAKEKDVFLDIGANMGVHSIFLDEKVKTVYSIEPHPVNMSFLSINSKTNKSGINMYECGFSDSEDYIKISGPRKRMEVDGSASINGDSDEKGNTVSVRLERGDEFLQKNRLEIPQIIKIDVEGAEMSVLRGLENILEHPDCRIIYCEVHGDEFREVSDFINSYGYSTSVIGDGRIIKAVRG